jgi:hypothetical protein
MKRQPRSTRKPFLALGSMLALVALFALAGPAAAHHSSRDFDADDPAGTIASYDADSGVLVLDLADGGSVSGLVTRYTWIDAGDHDGCDRSRHSQRHQLHGNWCRRQLHHFGGDHSWPHGPRGSSDDLVPGAVVEDALLVLKDGRAFFAKVELED